MRRTLYQGAGARCGEAFKNANLTAGWSVEKEQASKESLLKENDASMRLPSVCALQAECSMGGGGCMGTGSKLMATRRSRSPKATSSTTSSSRRRAQRLELRVIIAPPPVPPRRNQKPKIHFTPGKGAPCVPNRQLADELAETIAWRRSHVDLRQLDVPAGCHVSLRTSPVHILQSNNPTRDPRIIRTVAKRVSDYEINSPNEIRVAAEESYQRWAIVG